MVVSSGSVLILLVVNYARASVLDVRVFAFRDKGFFFFFFFDDGRRIFTDASLFRIVLN